MIPLSTQEGYVLSGVVVAVPKGSRLVVGSSWRIGSELQRIVPSHMKCIVDKLRLPNNIIADHILIGYLKLYVKNKNHQKN